MSDNPVLAAAGPILKDIRAIIEDAASLLDDAQQAQRDGNQNRVAGCMIGVANVAKAATLAEALLVMARLHPSR